MLVCFALLWRRNGAVLVAVNDMSTKGKVQQKNQNTSGLKLGELGLEESCNRPKRAPDVGSQESRIGP